ncbi:hypothetical protein BDW22DRAFT_1352847 [Trametopsis cervina]|nr:hypothetical protein BDW22DRAFT_1352847 [Trametopsis cervina]
MLHGQPVRRKAIRIPSVSMFGGVLCPHTTRALVRGWERVMSVRSIYPCLRFRWSVLTTVLPSVPVGDETRVGEWKASDVTPAPDVMNLDLCPWVVNEDPASDVCRRMYTLRLLRLTILMENKDSEVHKIRHTTITVMSDVKHHAGVHTLGRCNVAKFILNGVWHSVQDGLPIRRARL